MLLPGQGSIERDYETTTHAPGENKNTLSQHVPSKIALRCQQNNESITFASSLSFSVSVPGPMSLKAERQGGGI